VEDVAFERMDKRLAHKLLELSHGGDVVDITHQGLAVELGSAREVVSRLMKDFARRGWISAGRGHVELRDRDALAAVAEER
jgi:CRP/FNR family transcriptional regulator